MSDDVLVFGLCMDAFADDAATPEELVAAREDVERLRGACARLLPIQRDALSEATLEETAAKYTLSPSRISVLRERAFATLLREFRQQDEQVARACDRYRKQAYLRSGVCPRWAHAARIHARWRAEASAACAVHAEYERLAREAAQEAVRREAVRAERRARWEAERRASSADESALQAAWREYAGEPPWHGARRRHDLPTTPFAEGIEFDVWWPSRAGARISTLCVVEDRGSYQSWPHYRRLLVRETDVHPAASRKCLREEFLVRVDLRDGAASAWSWE